MMSSDPMGIGPLHDLAIQLDDQAQDAVAAGCSGPKLRVKLRRVASIAAASPALEAT
jgi:hypothetical protein